MKYFLVGPDEVFLLVLKKDNLFWNESNMKLKTGNCINVFFEWDVNPSIVYWENYSSFNVNFLFNHFFGRFEYPLYFFSH
jgi:hypothetical protein